MKGRKTQQCLFMQIIAGLCNILVNFISMSEFMMNKRRYKKCAKYNLKKSDVSNIKYNFFVQKKIPISIYHVYYSNECFEILPNNIEYKNYIRVDLYVTYSQLLEIN